MSTYHSNQVEVISGEYILTIQVNPAAVMARLQRGNIFLATVNLPGVFTSGRFSPTEKDVFDALLSESRYNYNNYRLHLDHDGFVLYHRVMGRWVIIGSVQFEVKFTAIQIRAAIASNLTEPELTDTARQELFAELAGLHAASIGISTKITVIKEKLRI